MIVRNCKKWIIASETLYRTNVQQSVVSNCVDLTHHFILKYTAYYYYYNKKGHKNAKMLLESQSKRMILLKPNSVVLVSCRKRVMPR